MSLNKFLTSLAALAGLWAFSEGLAQSPSASPKSWDQTIKDMDDWMKQNFPHYPTATPARQSGSFESRDKELEDAQRQFEADMAKHQSDPKWSYRESSDPMGRGVTKISEVRSTNSVTFGFPYTGEQQATLRLQRNPLTSYRPASVTAYLELQHCQFLFQYDEYGGIQSMSVRFDHGEIERMPGSPLGDGITNVAEIEHREFFSKLRKARTVRIEATFFQEGTRVFEFDVHGLDKSW